MEEKPCVEITAFIPDGSADGQLETSTWDTPADLDSQLDWIADQGGHGPTLVRVMHIALTAYVAAEQATPARELREIVLRFPKQK